MINSEQDLIALLEDGPQHVDDLRAWLRLPRTTLMALLHRLHRDGQVRQLVRDGRWALATYVKPRVWDAKPEIVRIEEGRTIRVIDGVEYEVVTLDELQARLAEAWPSRGSSLTDVNAPLAGHWEK